MSTDLPGLPARDSSGHKGTFGTVCVVGGQAAPPRVMIGGPALSALAALRSGAGLAVLAVPAPIMPAALVIAPGATGLALPVIEPGVLDAVAAGAILAERGAEMDCLAVGPGWGSDTAQQVMLRRILLAGEVPRVLDADALNAFALMPAGDRVVCGPIVVTPHPGEYRRLARAVDVDADPVTPEARPEAARRLAARLGAVVVLKGPGTVISDGERVAVNATGGPALATAGTGDVLTGVLAAFVAQFARPRDGDAAARSLFDCARLACHVHGLAADRWAERHGPAGMLATDLVDELPDALAVLRAGG